MRRGIDDSAESEDNFFRILDGAFQSGISAVTVHGRTVEQKYIGPSNWEFLRRVKSHLGSRTMLGSGDLFTPVDCLRMLEDTGVDGVTVARGAIGNPWIFSQAAALARGMPLPDPPNLFEQRAVIREHFSLAAEIYPPNRVGPIMRKFGIKYSILHPQHDLVRADFVKVRERRDWEAVLDRWYKQDLQGVHPDGRMHKAQGSCDFSSIGK
jgi:tRNA-dihydrouridine synthase